MRFYHRILLTLFTTRNEARMFERFTDSARRVINISEELNDTYVGSEHLVLALIIAEEEEVSPRTLTALGATRQKFREMLAKLSDSEGERQITISAFTQVPFTPRAKEILELSLREALSLGHNYIGTEHILLGFVRENEGVGVRVLAELDINLYDVRERVVESFNSHTTEPIKTLEHTYGTSKSRFL